MQSTKTRSVSRVKGTRPRTRTTTSALSDTSLDRHSPRTLWLICGILVAATLAVYAQSFGFDFCVLDDDRNIYSNPHYNPPTADTIPFFWLHDYNSLYTPVTSTIWALIALASHSDKPVPTPYMPTIMTYLSPGMFHAAGVILHILVVLCVFALFLQFAKSPWAAGAGALTFAIHPVQVESVAWITGMNNVITGLFCALALLTYVRYAQMRHSDRGGTSVWLFYGASIVFFALALLAKPSSAAMFIAAWALDYCLIRGSAKAATVAILPWLVLSIACFIKTQGISAVDMSSIAAPPLLRPIVAGDAITFYLYKVLLPYPLAADYGRPPTYIVAHAWSYATCLVPVLLGVCLWRFRRGLPYVVAAAGLFVAGILPVIGLEPYYFHAISTEADRYLYLSMLGPALAVAWLLERYSVPRAFLAYGLVAGVWLCLSIVQTGYWKNSKVLFEHAVRVNPQSRIGNFNLGAIEVRQGNPDAGIPHLKTVLKYHPDAIEARGNLANALTSEQRYDEAISVWNDALTYWQNQHVDSAIADTLVSMGLDQSDEEKTDDAIASFMKALQYEPNSAKAEDDLGFELMKEKRFDEALTHLRRSVSLDSSSAFSWSHLGSTLFQTEQWSEAAADFERALAIMPNDPTSHFDLGVSLVHLNQLPGAAEQFADNVQLNPNDTQSQQALARVQQMMRK